MTRGNRVFGSVAILGMGLLGGSLARAIRQRGLAQRVIGFAPRPVTVHHEMVDQLHDQLADWITQADLIIYCGPPSLFDSTLGSIKDWIRPDALITDVVSTKQGVVRAASGQLGSRISQFVPAHPIAGSHLSGPDAADANLFESALVILTPISETSGSAISQVKAFWQALGARVEELSPQRHDEIYAAVSHLPHAWAFALIHTLSQQAGGEVLRAMAGAGLKDTTRIAGSSPELWADVLIENRDAMLALLADAQANLSTLNALVESRNYAELIAYMRRAKQWRDQM
jgi:prephenate dehydrogenase